MLFLNPQNLGVGRMRSDCVIFVIFVLLVVSRVEWLSVRVRLLLPRPFSRLVQGPALKKTISRYKVSGRMSRRLTRCRQASLTCRWSTTLSMTEVTMQLMVLANMKIIILCQRHSGILVSLDGGMRRGRGQREERVKVTY